MLEKSLGLLSEVPGHSVGLGDRTGWSVASEI